MIAKFIILSVTTKYTITTKSNWGVNIDLKITYCRTGIFRNWLFWVFGIARFFKFADVDFLPILVKVLVISAERLSYRFSVLAPNYRIQLRQRKHGVTTGYITVCCTFSYCVRCWSMKPNVWKFFGNISENSNFQIFLENSENSEKYPFYSI